MVETPVIKLRPIGSHFIHPGQLLVRKVARALAVLLNTPREMAVEALKFWLTYQFTRMRQQPFFAISKDSKKKDHRGRPCAEHYREMSVETRVALVEWELKEYATFGVLGNIPASCLLHCKGCHGALP